MLKQVFWDSAPAPPALVTALSHSSSAINFGGSGESSESYIEFKARLHLDPELRFSLGIQYLRFTPGYVGNVVGWGG